jgi:threonine aldolase
MVSFECDYIAGAHPEILKRLAETNMESLPGYGMDHYTASAKEKIKAACGCPEAEVEFLVGGTQTNSVIISTMLRDWEGVISADNGHIFVHESGAVEYSGHKVLMIPGKNGKLEAEPVRQFLKEFYSDVTHDHMVFPGMVYISHPTEMGTMYSKVELEELSALCHEYDMPLFLDGARLGYVLMSNGTDLTLKDIARLSA